MLMSPEHVFCVMSERLRLEEDLELSRNLVELFNHMLVLAPEAFELREKLTRQSSQVSEPKCVFRDQCLRCLKFNFETQHMTCVGFLTSVNFR